RLSTLGQVAATASARRGSDARRLSPLFRGELDWVVMKALEKDRNRRYESASAFAADVRRDPADEPGQACPPGAPYRVGKFARRNKGACAAAFAAALVVMVAVVGLAVSNVLIAREKDEKVEALSQARRSEDDANQQRREAQENLKQALAAVD